MQIIFTIPDAEASRLIDGICGFYDYDTNKLVGESKGAFAKRMLIKHLKSVAKTYETDAAARLARTTVEQIDTIIIT